jgi:hypothetical protein
MGPNVLLAICGFALCVLPASALAAPPAAASAAPPLADPAAYAARQFGPSFTVDPKVPPLFADLDGDGDEDLVLVATSPTPLLSQELFHFKAEDPYDAYFGTGDVKITSTFTLHFDGSGRQILIVFGWRLPPEHNAKRTTKFVLINTPFETISIAIAKMRIKKKDIQAMETVDRTSTHALVFWDGKRWRWSAQGLSGDDLRLPSQQSPVNQSPGNQSPENHPGPGDGRQPY